MLGVAALGVVAVVILLPFTLLLGVEGVFVLAVRELGGRKADGWRWVATALAVPWIVVASIPSVGLTSPYIRLVAHYADYMRKVGNAAQFGQDYLTWNWTSDREFAPPELLLIWDGSDSLARRDPRDRPPPDDRGEWDMCRGRSSRLFRHFFLCSSADW
ncbi:MAG: hypothetical protein INR65_15385 [Gluconacetobacter diazotrophicus]|nr:hypothetical protein [Gluconacetobacter diazotrophicus]